MWEDARRAVIADLVVVKSKGLIQETHLEEHSTANIVSHQYGD